MKPKSFIYSILCVILLCSITGLSSARVFDRIIAFVNDDVITQRRLDILVNQRAFELQQVYSFTEGEALKEAEDQRGELLDRLIRQMLLLEAALTLKVQVTDSDIEEQIQDFKNKYQIPTDEEFKKLLNRDGLTFEAFREQIQRNLMTEKLVMGRIIPRLQVRDSDVQIFFEENRDQLPTKADRVHLRQIFVAFKPTDEDKKATSDVAIKALEEITSDKSLFQTVAQRISVKDNAGALIETTPSEILQYSDIFLTTLAKLGEGEISMPIEDVDGIHIFYIETRTDENINFRHLQIPFQLSEKAIQDGKDRSVDIIKKLEAGEEFKTIAGEYSDDEKTKNDGGNLGVGILTELNPQIREIVEDLEVGIHSKPFENEMGTYIYMVEERTTPELTPAEKQQIVGILRQQLFEKEWTAYTDSLLENAYIKIKPDAVPKPETKVE